MNAPAVIHKIEDADDEELLRELLRRAATRVAGEPRRPVSVIPIHAVRHRPITTIEAELQVAAEDLAAFKRLTVTGKSAQSKRQELQSRVNALEAELDASRSATTGRDSVAEL